MKARAWGQLLADLYSRVGEFHTARKNLRLSDGLANKIADKLASPPDQLAGKQVKELITTDGVKMLLDDGSWALFRKSGTEPVVRVYTEAGSKEELESLTAAAVGFVES